jgi:anti-anti-sigma factor
VLETRRSLTLTQADGAAGVVVEGDLDLTLAEDVRMALSACDPRDRLEVDLRDVRFVDSAGLALLLELRRDADERPGRVRVVPPRDAGLTAFDVLGLEDLLPWSVPASAPAAAAA